MTDPMEIPASRLSDEALRGLIEEFVSREGTDYGQGTPRSLEGKVADVRGQLDSSEAVILFDPESGSCNIALRRDLDEGAGG